ncbi:gamma-secretase subunit pen-2 [Ctenocephalides felis]|uniref:gamma-secretase subunit pen-2 n=1 Tax=Ctenocephalides felis TaxID=7515 RepID=UPI000E6E20F4|nr:gamma-secretase subunit pen-2 [Ctenocephalides felis]XP_026467085.1 gamma-secretase subunit pen-2 [Ctenocephalides felis]
MDISKVSNERKLYLCRWYFRAGFAILPFVWAINSIWFFDDAFKKSYFEQQKDIRKYVIYSAIGTFIWIALLSAWVTVFQLKRASWEDSGDLLSFIIPLGFA